MRYLILLALLAPISLNAGTIQKWIDEDGNVHYGDTPPVSAKTEAVRVQSAPKNPGKALPRLSSPGQGEATEEAGAEAAENNEPAAQDTQQAGASGDQAKLACETAQEDLRVIKRSSRIRLRLSDGSTRLMTPDEIEERKTRAEAEVEKYCG